MTDAQTGEPLAGVQAYLEGTGRGVLSAENGRYFLINVRPGVYTVVAELIGYQTFRKENIQINIDQTRHVDFELTPQAIALEELRVEADRTPLVRVDATGAQTTTTSAELEALPVTSVEQALTLQAGFISTPANTNIQAFNDTRRALTPIRIRGGRAGETLTLIDGIPINNFVFGGPSFSVTRKAVDLLDFIRGGFEPQYGNALSGIINVSTREGGTEFEGAFEYQTSELAGMLGSEPDDLENFDFFEGYVAGPVPGTEFGGESDRIRFMLAGRQVSGADRVLEFDDVFDPSVRGQPDLAVVIPAPSDLFAGWRGLGYDQTRDIMGKLTFLVTPTAKLNLSVIDYQRQHQPFDFAYLFTYTNPLDSPIIDTLADSASVLTGFQIGEFDVVQGSVEINRQLFTASWSQTLGRTAYSLKGGIFKQDRTTCNFFGGICLADSFDGVLFDHFAFPPFSFLGQDQTPASGTDPFGFGGEDLATYVGRFDIQAQASDHHNLQAGVYFESHDLDHKRIGDFGTHGGGLPVPVEQNYSAQPWNAAAYVQDKIEYDFVAIALGFRFDWGRAGGLFFADPLDPTNGTTALDVCAHPEAFAPVEHPVAGDLFTPNPDWTPASCGEDASRDSAGVVAFGDDYAESPSTRTQFSPRVGVSFPVTASSSVFFNFSRLSQNPLYNNIYQNTSIGTAGEGIPCGFAPVGADQVVGCGPILAASNYVPPFLGNPNLLTESTTTYEVGYLAEFLDNYGIQLILFNKDQYGLTGLRQVLGINDPAATYLTATPQYHVLLNEDYQTVRGFEIALRRRVMDYWGFDLNYSWSQARTNAAPPDREFENQEDNQLPAINREIISDIDQPHRFNGILFFAAGPKALWAPLRHSRLTATLQVASGFPYTPVRGFELDENFNSRLLRNTGRAPTIWQVDLIAQKNFRLGNLLYGAFLRVDNVFDTKNCIQPYETTGNCEAGTFDQNRIPGRVRLVDRKSTSFDNPQYYGPRRRIAVGLRMSF